MSEVQHYNKVVLMEHEMEVDGLLFKETEEVSKTFAESQDEPMITIVTHTRMIGNRVLEIKQKKSGDQIIDKEVNTTMSQDEVEQFEQDWAKMWNPRINEDEAAQEIGPTLALEKKDIDE